MTRARAVPLSASLCAIAALLAPPASAQVPSEAIAAVVGGPTPAPGVDVILLSDVVLRAHLELALAGVPGPHRAGSELLAATLEEIVGEVLVAREANRLGTADPSDADVARERERIVASLGGPSAFGTFLAAEDATDAEIEAIATRRARVAAFFRANLEGTSEISDAQVEALHARGEHPLSDRPLEEVREALRAWMAAQAVRADVRRWLEVLEGRTVVRIFLPSLERSAEASGGPAW